MAKAKHFDVVVIGTGPGGEGAAMKCAKSGLRVAVIEQYNLVGGGCTHWGTIPSKALRHSVSRLIEYNSNSMYREHADPIKPTFPQILRNAESVIARQVKLRTGFYSRNRVEVIFGRASMVDEKTVEVRLGHGGVKLLKTEQVVIAAGSRPFRPAKIDFSHPRVYDSDTILSLKHTPRSIIIYGAGVIGCEYASIFRGLGVNVDLINTRDRLLSFMDDEITDALSYHLRDQDVLVRHNEMFDSVECFDRGVIFNLQSGKKVRSDALLWAAGRTGNTHNMGLEEIGVKPNDRGQLEVDEHYRTSLPHIYAVGDVIGWPSLASAAYDQGRTAAAHIVGEPEAEFVSDVPSGIYTIPEISSVGRTEAELTQQKIPYEVGHAFFKDLAHAQIAGATVGMLKILFHRENKEILGVHCFGERASEIIHIGQAIMKQADGANNIEYFIKTTFNYPTMAEAYRVAALNGLNRLF